MYFKQDAPIAAVRKIQIPFSEGARFATIGSGELTMDTDTLCMHRLFIIMFPMPIPIPYVVVILAEGYCRCMSAFEDIPPRISAL